MWRRMKVAARLAMASALDEVHAHRYVVVAVDGHAVRRMSIATFRLRASANAALILATNLLVITQFVRRPTPAIWLPSNSDQSEQCIHI